MVTSVTYLFPNPPQVSTAKESHSVAKLKMIFGELTDAFRLNVVSIAKFATPPLNVPIMSINTTFLNKPTGSFPLKVSSTPAVEIFALEAL